MTVTMRVNPRVVENLSNVNNLNFGKALVNRGLPTYMTRPMILGKYHAERAWWK